MPEQKRLAQLFQEKPAQWGMRGDPHLWKDMAERLGNLAYPDTEAELKALLEATYEQLVGVPVSRTEPIFIERYSHGGMSSGYIFPEFWSKKGIPLLCARYREIL